ncbi:MAG: rod shape-determining protein MreC [Bacteriovoracaceae bacterium]|nr:rod shape-determining protein MreC [Bacteriovoracaceae bacterium]
MRIWESQGQRLKLVLNIVVLGLALFSFSRKNTVFRSTSAFENLMIDSVTPLQRGVSYLHKEVTDLFEHYVNNVSASKEKGMLIKKVGQLENELFEMEEMKKENQRLKGYLEFGSDLKVKKILAQIVSWDSSSDYKVLRINKGIKSGIRLQSPVVTSIGLVGYIYRLTDHYADVLTILDPSNRIDGLVSRTRAHGILEGDSDDRLVMKYVTRTKPIILNDLVLTSGLGNIYPKGLKIGRVARIERESYGITQHVEITPEVDFGGLEEIIVLVSSLDEVKKIEWDALDKEDQEKR